MKRRTKWIAVSNVFIVVVLLALGSDRLVAQTCTTGDEMDAATRTSLDNAARQFFQMAQQGDTASMQRQSIPAVSSGFSGIATAVNDVKSAFSGAQANIRGEFILDNTAPPSQPAGASGENRSEFFCGIFNSPDRVGFVFPQLPQGKYGVVIMDVNGKPPYLLSLILQQQGAQWQLAGFFPKAQEIAGHNPQWYVIKAREYKQKGQLHNSWFYYQLAYDLWQPFPAMSAPTLDKLYDEMMKVQPNDVPANGPVNMNFGGKTYQVTSMFPAAVADALDLVVKYQTPDISDTAKAFQDNTTVIKGVVAKFPELREAFGGVVARAVAPSGQDYGTLLAMRDLK